MKELDLGWSQAVHCLGAGEQRPMEKLLYLPYLHPQVRQLSHPLGDLHTTFRFLSLSLCKAVKESWLGACDRMGWVP